MDESVARAEQRLEKRLRNLKPTKKNIKGMATELKNIRSPELRKRLMDFILMGNPDISLTTRILMTIEGNLTGGVLSDDFFLDEFLALFSPEKNVTFGAGGRAMGLALFISRALPLLTSEAADRVMGVATRLFADTFLDRSNESECFRNALLRVVHFLKDTEYEKRYLKPLVDILLTRFEEFDWENLVSSIMFSETGHGPSLKSFMSGLWNLLENNPEEENFERAVSVMMEGRTPALLLAGLAAHNWPFGEATTKGVVETALCKWGEKELEYFLEYFHNELYKKAPTKTLREECLEKAIAHARESGRMRGLVLLGKRLLSKIRGGISLFRRGEEAGPPVRNIEITRHLERVLDGLIGILKDTVSLTAEEWAERVKEHTDHGDRAHRVGGYDNFTSPSKTPMMHLLEFASKISRYGELMREEQGVFAELLPIWEQDMLEKIFAALLDSLRTTGSSRGEPPYPGVVFPSLFDNFAKVFLSDKKATERFIEVVAKCGYPDICISVVNYIGRGDITEENNRQAERVITTLMEGVVLQASGAPSSGGAGDSLRPDGVAVEGKALELFAPYFAREFSKTPALLTETVFTMLFESPDLAASQVSGLLLFSGELTGEAYELVRNKSYRNLGGMINTFLGGPEGPPWWFDRETFMKECIRFTDRPRKFSLNIPATEKFLDIAAGFLSGNPGNVWATELTAEFLRLCARGVLQGASDKIEKGSAPSPWCDRVNKSLGELESLLGAGLSELETGSGQSQDMLMAF